MKSGVALTDRLVDNPQESTSEGDLVHIAGEPDPEPGATAAAAPPEGAPHS